MSNNLRGDVHILVVDPDLGTQNSVRMILHNSGFRQLDLGETLEDIRSALSEEPPDLLISECELSDGDFGRFVRDLRHHEIGSNPFIPIIALSSRPTPELVQNVVDAGVDDLLSKPISSGHLLNRIQALVNARKPFVVTSDYVGPDRRKESDRKMQIPRIVVPNALKSKIAGSPEGGGKSERAIADAVNEINQQKLERHAVQIGVLVNLILPAYEEKKVDERLFHHLDRLQYVAEDTSRRLGGTKYDHVSELCQSLISVTSDIRTIKENPRPKDLKLLTPLSQSIQTAFDVTEDVAEMARKISASIAEGADS